MHYEIHARSECIDASVKKMECGCSALRLRHSSAADIALCRHRPFQSRLSRTPRCYGLATKFRYCTSLFQITGLELAHMFLFKPQLTALSLDLGNSCKFYSEFCSKVHVSAMVHRWFPKL